MQTIDKNQARSKAFSIKAVMKDPKLARIVFDAWDAAPGSTKKARAKAILKSLNKSSTNYNRVMDGQGGSGFQLGQAAFGDLLSPAQLSPKPKPKATSAPEVAPVLPGAPLQTKFVKSIDHLVSDPSKLSVGMGPGGTLTSQSTPAIMPGNDSYIDPATGQLKKIIPGITPPTFSTPHPASATQSKTPLKSVWNQEKANQLYTSYLKSGGSMPGTDPAARVKELTGFAPTNVDKSSGDLGVGDEIGYEELFDMKSKGNESDIDAWYNGLDKSSQDYMKEVYEAVKTGYGPTTFQMKVLSNKPLLAKLLKVPEESLKNFPTSGLLSDYLADLQEATDKDFQIEEQYNKLLDSKTRGLSLERDLQAYVRGKDEYLGKIDKLLDNAKTKIATMDTSNPNVAKRVNNYVNYLTILQGRQNQRYVDFLNSSVQEYNDKLQSDTAIFQLGLANAEKRYNREAAVTTESYNMIKGMLGELYTNVEGRTKALRENEKWEMEKLSTQYDIMKKIAEIEKINKEVNSGNYEKFTGYKIYDEILGVQEDKDGNILGNNIYDPYDAMKRAKEVNQDPKPAFYRYLQIAQQNLTNKASTGNVKDEVTRYNEYASELAKAVQMGMNPDVTNSMSSEEQAALKDMNSVYEQMREAMEKGVGAGIKRYLQSSEENINNVRDAIEELVGKGWFRGAKDEGDKNNFVGKYKGSLGDIAEYLFDYYAEAKSRGYDPDEIFDVNGVSAWDADDGALTNAISPILRDMAIYHY